MVTHHNCGLDKVGGSDFRILNKTRVGLVALWGGLFWASSIRVIPTQS